MNSFNGKAFPAGLLIAIELFAGRGMKKKIMISSRKSASLLHMQKG
jgi:hypothetical protein